MYQNLNDIDAVQHFFSPLGLILVFLFLFLNLIQSKLCEKNL